MFTFDELESLGFRNHARFNDWVREERDDDWKTGNFRPLILVSRSNGEVAVGPDDCNMSEMPGVKTIEDLKEFLRLCGY